jgi:hypothetical protein
VKRWLLLALALALAALVVWSRAGRAPERIGGAPLDRIDDASRENLREVLRESDAP